MYIEEQKLKYWSACVKNSAYLSLAIFLVSTGLGCASTQRTTKTETTVTYSDEAAGNKGYLHNSGVVEKSETTTATTTDTKTAQPGIISSTIHAIGYVISLPFILIGHLLRAIF